MPLSNRTTPANGSETNQVIPLLDSERLRATNAVDPVNPESACC
ncbi:hypothetical protein RintRC_5804 [Richelia intracellularis]|nr:hypothetical protein RintRC_5804 [Richelia intracellularis]